MKKMMRKIAAALLALACLPVTGMTAAAEVDLTALEGTDAWEQLHEMKLVGQVEDKQLYLIEPENADSFQLAIVTPQTHKLRMILRDDVNIDDAAKQIAEVLDAYFPGMAENYDAQTRSTSIPLPADDPRAEWTAQATFYQEQIGWQERQFDLYVCDLPEHTAELEANILRDVAKRHLISGFYGFGSVIVYGNGGFVGLDTYAQYQLQFTDRPRTYTEEPIDWDAVQDYLTVHYPNYSVEAYPFTAGSDEPFRVYLDGGYHDSSTRYRIIGADALTVHEQLELACELWEQLGVVPNVELYASEGSELTSHNALENPGDVTLDTEIDIMDVIAANKQLLGAETLCDTAKKNADVGGDGTPDETDSLAILKYVVGIMEDLT